MSFNPRLKTKRLTLRKVEPEDIDSIFKYASDIEIDRYVGWDYHKSIDDTKEFVDSILTKYQKDEPSDWGIIDNQAKCMIGTIGLFNYNKIHGFIEIGYALSREYWNKGIMTEALNIVNRYCYDELNVNRIEANCFIENIGSKKVLEKCGFRSEGILREKFYAKGKYNDVEIFSKIRNE